jgi:hypothetical protein
VVAVQALTKRAALAVEKDQRPSSCLAQGTERIIGWGAGTTDSWRWSDGTSSHTPLAPLFVTQISYFFERSRNRHRHRFSRLLQASAHASAAFARAGYSSGLNP